MTAALRAAVDCGIRMPARRNSRRRRQCRRIISSSPSLPTPVGRTGYGSAAMRRGTITATTLFSPSSAAPSMRMARPFIASGPAVRRSRASRKARAWGCRHGAGGTTDTARWARCSISRRADRRRSACSGAKTGSRSIRSSSRRPRF